MDFDALLKLMVTRNASDLFVTSGVPPCLKVNGKITPVAKERLTPDQARHVVFGIMGDDQRAEFADRLECNFALSRADIGRFRVNVFQQRNQVGMVLRRIETVIPGFDELKLPKILGELVMTKRGIIIMVGGTGSGKSTSLAAMVDYRNRHGNGHIITIEDPIEFVHEHKGCIVTQREVGIDTESFEKALVNTLRQAPDVILIGEIRHRETMEYAIAFAETGHLCLATLHANNANQAMDRIINFFPEDRHAQLLMDLSLNLKAVVAQRLLVRAHGEGRRVAVEVLVNTPYMADLIRKGDVPALKEQMRKYNDVGMRTFDQAIFELVKAGDVTAEEALRNADSANEMRMMIKQDKAEGDSDKLVSDLEDLDLQDAEDSEYKFS